MVFLGEFRLPCPQFPPRRINRLCDPALLIGFAEERQTLTAAHLEAVRQELAVVTPE